MVWFKQSNKDPTDESSNKDEDSERGKELENSDKNERASNAQKSSEINSGSDKDPSHQESAAKDKKDEESQPKESENDEESQPKESENDEVSQPKESENDKESQPKESENDEDLKPKESEKDEESKSKESEKGEKEEDSVEVPLEDQTSKSNSEGDSEKNSDIIRLEGDGPEYTFDQVIDNAGYGWFQTRLTFLAGMGWFADAFEIIILSLIGDYLACEWTLHQWEISFLTSTVFIGMIFGAPFFGVIADKYGRRMALAISLFFLFLFGACSAKSPNFVTLVTLRAIMGFSLGGIAQGVTLCSEYYPAKHRGIAGFYLSYFWAIGTELLLLIAWIIMNFEKQRYGWQYLLFAASLPALLVFILIKWYPESIRFYLVTQQYEKAVKQLNVLLKMNKATLEPGVLKTEDTVDEQKGNILNLLKPPHTLTTLLLWYIWFAVAYHYYGLVLIAPVILKNGKLLLSAEELASIFKTNATTSSEFFKEVVPCIQFTNQNYIDLAICSFAEVPGLLAFTILVRYIERKTLMGLSGFLNTVLVLLMLVDFPGDWPIKAILFIARANICGLFQLVFIMTSEIFPTTLRAVGMGSGSAFARIGGAVVPFATQGLVINDPKITVIMLSVVILLCALAAVFLPLEMKDRHMRDFTQEYKKEEEEEA